MKKILLLLFILLSSCAHESPRSPANFGDDFVEKISSLDLEKVDLSRLDVNSLSIERRKDLHIIKENFLKYLLFACFKEQSEKVKIIDQAESYFESMTMRLMENIAKEKTGLSDFYPIQRPPFWTLESEISFLNIEVRRQGFLTKISDETWEKYYSLIKEANLDQLPPELLKEVGGDFDLIGLIRQMQEAGTRKGALVQLHSQFETKFSEKLARFRNIGTEIVNSGVVKINNPLHEKFLKILLNTYFENLDREIIKTMVSEIISLGREAKFEDMAKVVFTNAGPAMGKIMQTLSKNPEIGKEFATMISFLESQNKAVPYHLVKKVLSDDNSGHIFTLIEEKALGTGTMAQVQRARVIFDDEEYDVAVRFMKPGIEARVENDLKILQLIVDKIKTDPDFINFKMLDFDRLLEVIKGFFESEMDLEKTTTVQQRIYPLYNRVIKVRNNKGILQSIQFRVPKIYPGNNEKSHLQVQELIKNGKKFSDLKDKEDQKLVARAFAELWFEEALLESGFLHADPHQGNMIIHKDPITKEISVAIFDYGMTAFLTKEVRRSFLMIGAGVELKNAELIYHGIVAVNPHFTEGERKVLKRNILEQFKLKSFVSSEDWIMWAVQNKYINSPDLGNLARGATLVKQMLSLTGDDDYLLKMLQKKVVQKLGKDMVDQSYDFPLIFMDKIRITKAVMIKSCQDLINFFLKFKK